MIQVEHLTKRYGSRKAVRDISFEVKQGEILGFLDVYKRQDGYCVSPSAL